MKVSALIDLLKKFEVENPEAIAQSSQDDEKVTNVDSVQYFPDNKLLYLIGDDL